jgi:hypothetical protein
MFAKKISQKVEHLCAIALPPLMATHWRQLVHVVMVRVSFQLLCVASPSGSVCDCRNNRVLGWSAVHADFYGNGTAKVPNIFAATDNRQKPVHAANRRLKFPI